MAFSAKIIDHSDIRGHKLEPWLITVTLDGAKVYECRNDTYSFSENSVQRLEWLDIAERNNAWLVEDDYDGEFRYQGDPIPALAGLMDNERTLYMGTFSKVLSPTLRMSYLVVPPSAVDAVRRIYPMLGNESSVVTQAVLAELIGSGHFAKHFKRMRSLYGERSARRRTKERSRRCHGSFAVM